jgi:hypothetical protein
MAWADATQRPPGSRVQLLRLYRCGPVGLKSLSPQGVAFFIVHTALDVSFWRGSHRAAAGVTTSS